MKHERTRGEAKREAPWSHELTGHLSRNVLKGLMFSGKRGIFDLFTTSQ